MNPNLGYGGVMTLDAGSHDRAAQLMVRLQEKRVGYLAVSLGYFKTLFSAPSSSTSSEIPSAQNRCSAPVFGRTARRGPGRGPP